MSYINGLDQSEDESQARECFLCQAIELAGDEEQRQQRLVLVNDKRGLLLLNRYPYTNGHLLIAPYQHVSGISDLDESQRCGLMDLVSFASRLLNAAMNPQGMNIGINIGRCAGAGLPGHIHIHVVPRWNGDVNYMQVVGGIRVIPQSLEAGYQLLKDTARKLSIENS